MKYDVLHNFISPVTGRILVDTDYVIIGDEDGIGVPSPILIDLQLDLINLRANYNILRQASFVIGEQNDQLPNAQVLDSLANGYMYNTDGVVSTIARIPITALPNLTENYLWIGDSEGHPVEVAHIEINNLPDLTYNRVWIGNSIHRPIESNFSIAPDDATYVIRTPSTFLPNAQILRDLGRGMAKISFGGYIEIANAGIDYVSPFELEKAIAGIEEELAALESEIEFELFLVELEIAGLELEIGLLELEILALGAFVEIELGIIEGEIIILGAALLGVLAQVFALEGTVAGLLGIVTYLEYKVDELQNRINNLRLNNIPADGNVSLYNYQIINLADPVNPQDAATKAYVDSVAGSGSTTLTGAVTGSGTGTIDTVFVENPVFLGNKSIRITVGTTAQRNPSPAAGEFRLNTDI